MGLFNLFGSREKRDEASIRKHGQRVTQKYGPSENRMASIAQLARMGTPEALATLCLRFTVYSEPSITDDEEKEAVRQHLVEAGPAALGPVKGFLEKQEEGVAWGLGILAALAPSEETRATVLALLERLGREYTRDPGKKLTLLGWLAEHQGDLGAQPQELERALLPLLEDSSDDVRLAAVRVLVRASAGDAAREAIIALFLRDKENARVRGEVLQALADLGADVKGHRPSVEPLVAEPYYLDREGRVKKRA